jgi:hypothetical protein
MYFEKRQIVTTVTLGLLLGLVPAAHAATVSSGTTAATLPGSSTAILVEPILFFRPKSICASTLMTSSMAAALLRLRGMRMGV